MKKELLFLKEYGADKSGARVYHLPEYEGIYIEWRGYLTTEEFKEISILSIDALEKLGCETCISNTLGLGPLSEEADRWVREEYTFRVNKTKVRKAAILLPKEFFAHLSVSEMSEAVKAEVEKGILNFETRYFEDRIRFGLV